MEKKVALKSNLEKKHDNFLRLAENRTILILKYMKLLGNLSNTHNYQYSDEEVSKIFSAIDSELKRIKILFKKPSFKDFKLSK